MRRNSTQLELISPGATTWLPWVSDPGSNRVDGYPNFDGFTGQSRTIRESAWQAFLDSGEELEIISDPEPPSPAPDWDKFIRQFTLAGNPLYHATASKVQISGPVVVEHWTNIRLGLLSTSIRNEEWLQLTYNYLKYLLDQAGNSLSEDEKQAWIDLAQDSNIKLT